MLLMQIACNLTRLTSPCYNNTTCRLQLLTNLTTFCCIIATSLGLRFLADRTNGRAYATVLCLSVRLSVCRLSSVTLCIVAKRCVLEQKLLLRAYRKSYMRNRLVPK